MDLKSPEFASGLSRIESGVRFDAGFARGTISRCLRKIDISWATIRRPFRVVWKRLLDRKENQGKTRSDSSVTAPQKTSFPTDSTSFAGGNPTLNSRAFLALCARVNNRDFKYSGFELTWYYVERSIKRYCATTCLHSED